MPRPPLSSAESIHERILREGRRPVEAGLLSLYRFRLLLGFAVALGGVLLAFHLPFYDPMQYVGWTPARVPERITLEQVPSEEEDAPDPGRDLPATLLARVEEAEKAPEVDETVEEAREPVKAELDSAGIHEPIPALAQLNRLKVLEFAEEQPYIPGGLGSLYLRIEYPEEARNAGIEGRVILNFVVETNGMVREINVRQAVHPLLDSAAVQALRVTRFTPGRQNGEVVPVRMTLPIRFKLITH